MNTLKVSGLDALAILLGSSMGLSPTDSLAAARSAEEEHDATLLDITPEIETKLQGWLTAAANAPDLPSLGAVIKEVGEFHDEPDTHSYRGLCQRIGALGETFSHVGAFKFGNEDYNKMIDVLWAE